MGLFDALKKAWRESGEELKRREEARKTEERRKEEEKAAFNRDQKQLEAYYNDHAAQSKQREYYQLLEKVQNDYKLVNQLGAFSSERGKTLVSDCRRGISLFEGMRRIWERYEQPLPRNPFYYQLALIYEKQGEYGLAAQTCVDAINAGYRDDGTKAGMEGRLARMIKKGKLDPTDEMSRILRIEKDDIALETDSKTEQRESGTLVTSEQKLSLLQLDGWNIAVSFGKSNSQNYEKALALAKAAPQYYEQEENGKIVHQAFYSDDPQEYLSFIMLYELVAGWKSSFAMINGTLVDRKIVGQLNYCYGDRCRSGNPKFCYGASFMTENPFGCHRLQISACNSPWWSFYRKSGGSYILDKETMREKIDAAAKIYSACPCFDYNRIMRELDRLPSSLTAGRYQKLLDEQHNG